MKLRAGIVLAFASSFSAQATPVVQTVSFTASDFAFGLGDGLTPPISPAKLSFQVALDTSVSASRSTSGLTVLSSNLPASWTYEYSYDPASDFLAIAPQATLTSCSYAPQGACSFVSHFSTAPTVTFFGEYVGTTLWYATTITPGIASDVPESATWAMMVGGLGLVGGALRRRSAARLVHAG